FDDPRNSSQRLMGWVVKDVFSNQPVVHAKGACPSGQTSLVADAAFCGKICKADSDCASGSTCSGTAQIALADGGTGDTVPNCPAIARPDAGAPTKDAGPPPPPDAGAPKPAPDAGGGATGPLLLDPKDGSCPAGYKLVDFDKKCHRSCQKSEDCGSPGVICTR